VVLSGTRTYAEQDALFAKGGVTKARGGFSNHNFGIAFDIGVFSGAKYLEESPLYKAVAVIGKGLGLSWGGDWKSFVDEPHYQLRPSWAKDMTESQMLAELRLRHDNSIPVFS
jgi:peptidoglycan L-alanyl-D-glutamate endopeptidase CwlK